MSKQDDCPHPHKIGIDWNATPMYTLPPNIVGDGECSEGCCDDFKCKECGYTFRIECPQ